MQDTDIAWYRYPVCSRNSWIPIYIIQFVNARIAPSSTPPPSLSPTQDSGDTSLATDTINNNNLLPSLLQF